MQNKVLHYGFVGHVVLPEAIANADSWSLLIRFSKLNTKGNFQLWNGKFFNFYNGGYEILIHKKWWDTDRYGSTSFAFVADGLNSPEYPELLTFGGRQMKHQCFDSSMHSGVRNSAAVNPFQTAVIEQAVGSRNVRTQDMSRLLQEAQEGITKVRSLNFKILKKAFKRRKTFPDKFGTVPDTLTLRKNENMNIKNVYTVPGALTRTTR